MPRTVEADIHYLIGNESETPHNQLPEWPWGSPDKVEPVLYLDAF